VTGASQILNPYGPDGDERPPVPLTTREGYAVLEQEVGSSVYDIYLQVSSRQFGRYVKDSSAPGDRWRSNRNVQPFLKNHQEVYDGRVAIDWDPDFDLISTIAENACGLNPNPADSDGDGILDTKADKNKNGRWDTGRPTRARELYGGSRLKASFHGIQIEGRIASPDAFARLPRESATSPVDSRC
jgi:hypothetical protein